MRFAARLQQQHRGAALRQARGQGAARAAGAHHDVVEVPGPAKERGRKPGDLLAKPRENVVLKEETPGKT